jgi:hypothetical protein
MRTSSLALAFALALCASATVHAGNAAEDAFFARVKSLCGQAFPGRMVAFDESSDGGWLNRPVTMHVRECSDREIRIPLHVGADRSRTWVITRTAAGLRLKHDHRHEDGSEDALTQYGGDSNDAGSGYVTYFPVDPFSKDLFVREGIPQSVTNVWSMEVFPEARFSYALRRPGRHFQADFDLTRPVDPPPPPWGAE